MPGAFASVLWSFNIIVPLDCNVSLPPPPAVPAASLDAVDKINEVALLDAERLGLGMSVYVAIKTNEHSSEWLKNFAIKISGYDEVVEFYRMSGDVDYMLRVVVKNMSAYDQFYKKLISDVSLKDVSSSFAMEEIKYTTSLPINQL